MKRTLLIVFIFVGIIFIVAQFFNPAKNEGQITADHITRHETVPPQIQEILENACLDCHSNTTQYLWYHRVAPVSWMINGHIVDGKKELNLSEWGTLDAFSKMDALDEMCEEVEKGNMPIKPYAAIHKKARLTKEEREILCVWMEKRIEELMAGSVEG